MGESSATYGGTSSGDGDYPSSRTRKSDATGSNAGDAYHERTKLIVPASSLAATLPG